MLTPHPWDPKTLMVPKTLFIYLGDCFFPRKLVEKFSSFQQNIFQFEVVLYEKNIYMIWITISQMELAAVEVAQHDFEAIHRVWTVQFEIHCGHWILLIFF